MTSIIWCRDRYLWEIHRFLWVFLGEEWPFWAYFSLICKNSGLDWVLGTKGAWSNVSIVIELAFLSECWYLLLFYSWQQWYFDFCTRWLLLLAFFLLPFADWFTPRWCWWLFPKSRFHLWRVERRERYKILRFVWWWWICIWPIHILNGCWYLFCFNLEIGSLTLVYWPFLDKVSNSVFGYNGFIRYLW